MNTQKPRTPLEQALAKLPDAFRRRVIDSYLELKRRDADAQFDSAGLSAGKFCEVLLRLLQHEITGTHIPFGKKIPNLADECQKLINSPQASALESLRVIIPRAISFVYTLRNKRGIGHVGGDVDANRIDSAVIARVADWVICELIRIYHNFSLEEAQDLIDNISYKMMPDVWEVAGKKRVLKPGLSAPEKVLMLLYGQMQTAIPAEDLCSWIEYSRLADFKNKVLIPLHHKRLIEYDMEADIVYLSPTGAKRAEEILEK